jgi:hypothetical protein
LGKYQKTLWSLANVVPAIAFLKVFWHLVWSWLKEPDNWLKAFYLWSYLKIQDTIYLRSLKFYKQGRFWTSHLFDLFIISSFLMQSFQQFDGLQFLYLFF